MSDSTAYKKLVHSPTELLQERQEEQFLRFHLEPETKIMLPIEQVTEVLKIGVGKIVPIPQMPTWVMGVYNWRGEILWIVDLGHLIGLSPWDQQEMKTTAHTAVVLSYSGQSDKGKKSQTSLGLIMTRVEDIELCNSNLIQSPPASAITSDLAPFLRGYWAKPDGQIILVLDGDAIVAAIPQN
ncbi:chemotaxis signal transduction protein [Xenococcus sp. PCC 7305]|uniref:chemotaxis protein CheW n=1 Tax=Xenococcus sp. PCC 7305 TaxID=102125 RepID=UPI0002ACA228|nr:chemotaxis protein CheW [Xenococcus sp. PCC 7305]ELS01049.1 chemotaxis signal transduction protein [Xenococcus sp. PCC 7305]